MGTFQRMLKGKNIPKEQKHEALFSTILKSKDGGTLSLDPKFQLICDCKQKFNHLHKEKCPSCFKEIDKMENPKYLEYNYYYNVQRKKNKLSAKTIREDKILQTLESEVLDGILLNPELLYWSKKYIQELKVKELEEKRLEKEVENKTLTNLISRKARVKELLISGALSEEEYKLEIIEIECKLNTIKSK